MNKVLFSAEFRRKAKPLVKKYPTLKDNIENLGAELFKNPFLGESYGSGIYKIRLADESKGKGKRGGFRVMYYTAIETQDSIEILLMSIYDKGELDTITKKDAARLLQKVLFELKQK
jgi:mRNA-degrading endonuclease RelE of RelBE toxin-antitoxin system